ncbi:hypothetical protein [Tenacibaculum maritimum]|uniref:hypothetical protein n=6 Tax=Tenacibaculum maritimum TaxID=107401 RepID=UPI0012E680A2|nr:hypothetical protein [Tenacibaculum maritimum]CAA0207976.1 conserved hypothetical protein [Tenacibaculum maritimum]
MRGIFYFILFFLGLASIFMTINDVINNRYLKEIKNIKSLNNKGKYMTEDLLLITEETHRNPNASETIRFDIEGILQSNDSIISLKIGFPEYLNFDLKYQPVYKSKLTGTYYLKNAPSKYYNGKLRGLCFAILLKICFYPILIIIIIFFRKYYKQRTFRI